MFVISFSRNPSRIIVPKYFFSPNGNDEKFKKASARSPAEVDVMAFKKKTDVSIFLLQSCFCLLFDSFFLAEKMKEYLLLFGGSSWHDEFFCCFYLIKK